MRATKSGLSFILTAGLLGGSVVDAAAQDGAVAPEAFSGVVHCGSQIAYGTSESQDVMVGDTAVRVVSERGHTWRPSAPGMSDPRLQGDYTISFDSDAYYPADAVGSIDVGAGTWRIENDEGAWQGSYHIVGDAPVVVPLVGEGAYDGLTAVVESAFDGAACSWEWSGVIFAGDAPAYPEPPTE